MLAFICLAMSCGPFGRRRARHLHAEWHTAISSACVRCVGGNDSISARAVRRQEESMHTLCGERDGTTTCCHACHCLIRDLNQAVVRTTSHREWQGPKGERAPR